MKRILVLFLALVLIPCCVFAETETVVQMTCIVKMPDVIREGKYTGEVQNGTPHGYGMFETANSEGIQWHYIGQWSNGEMCGEGGCYWQTGQSQVGTYEHNKMVCGEYHTSASGYAWYDFRTDDNNRVRVKLFRSDQTMYFDGYADSVTAKPLSGDVYSQNGKLFFSGEFGDGFNWDLIYVE